MSRCTAQSSVPVCRLLIQAGRILERVWWHKALNAIQVGSLQYYGVTEQTWLPDNCVDDWQH